MAMSLPQGDHALKHWTVTRVTNAAFAHVPACLRVPARLPEAPALTSIRLGQPALADERRARRSRPRRRSDVEAVLLRLLERPGTCRRLDVAPAARVNLLCAAAEVNRYEPWLR